jgi:PIN domain nuclease of toxin-antitoxin system
MILIDTHVLIWLDQASEALGSQAKSIILSAKNDNKLYVSAISFCEIANKCISGKLSIGMPLNKWRQDLLSAGLIEFPIDGLICITSQEIELHKDPADRMIVATAMRHDALLVTADEKILPSTLSFKRFNAKY